MRYTYLIYGLTLISTFLFGWLYDRYSERKKYNNYIFVMIIIFILVYISGNRLMDTYLSDEWVYRNSYSIIGEKTFFELLKLKGDIGFAILNWCIYRISTNSQVLILVCSIITIIPIIVTIFKYSKNIGLSIFLYVTMGYYIASFNIIRQSIAGAILFLGIKYFCERKTNKYLILVLIASLLHSSAIIMIPVYFLLNNRKAWGKISIIIIIIGLTSYLFFDQAADIVFKVLNDTKYGIYQQNMNEVGYGVNILRVIVYFAPLIVSFIFRNNLKVDKNNNYYINLYLIGAVFMLLANKYVYFSRLDSYFGLYGILLIPEFITCISDKKLQRITSYGIMVCYLLFFWYQTRIGVIYSSYF